MDSVVVYNRYVNGLKETEYYVETRFDNVWVELTKGTRVFRHSLLLYDNEKRMSYKK